MREVCGRPMRTREVDAGGMREADADSVYSQGEFVGECWWEEGRLGVEGGMGVEGGAGGGAGDGGGRGGG